MNINKSLNKVLEHKKKDIVPYDKQSPEQREEFMGAVKILNAIKIMRGVLTENWVYIALAKPDRRQDDKVMFDHITKATRILRELIKLSRTLDNQLSVLMVKDENARDLVDLYTHNGMDILDALIRVPYENAELAIETIQSLTKGHVKAVSDEDYVKKIQYIIKQTTGKNVDLDEIEKHI